MDAGQGSAVVRVTGKTLYSQLGSFGTIEDRFLGCSHINKGATSTTATIISQIITLRDSQRLSFNDDRGCIGFDFKNILTFKRQVIDLEENSKKASAETYHRANGKINPSGNDYKRDPYA